MIAIAAHAEQPEFLTDYGKYIVGMRFGQFELFGAQPRPLADETAAGQCSVRECHLIVFTAAEQQLLIRWVATG